MKANRVQHDLAQQTRLLRLQLFHSRPRDQRHIAGNQRQDAGRQKRDQSGSERCYWQRKVLRGEEITEFGLLKEAGAACLTDGGRSVQSAGLMRAAMS